MKRTILIIAMTIFLGSGLFAMAFGFQIHGTFGEIAYTMDDTRNTVRFIGTGGSVILSTTENKTGVDASLRFGVDAAFRTEVNGNVTRPGLWYGTTAFIYSADASVTYRHLGVHDRGPVVGAYLFWTDLAIQTPTESVLNTQEWERTSYHMFGAGVSIGWTQRIRKGFQIEMSYRADFPVTGAVVTRSRTHYTTSTADASRMHGVSGVHSRVSVAFTAQI